jgi:D-amino peptidase
MKVYVSVDMEGVTGVTTREHCVAGAPEYERFRRLMTADANAAIEGAFAGGATEIVVNDSHASMTNVLIEELDPRARLISGSNKLFCQMEGLDASFDAVLFVGYHQGDGAGDGIVNHTISSAAALEIRLNGTRMDELSINAALAGSFGVPVAFVSGDDVTCADARVAVPEIHAAVVKEAVDRSAGLCLPPAAAHALIRGVVTDAMASVRGGRIPPVDPPVPVDVEIDFRSTSSALMCTLMPHVSRPGPRTAAFTAPDYPEAMKSLWGLLILGASAVDGVL